MKRTCVAGMCLLTLLLFGCRTALDVSKMTADLYQSGIEAVVKISTLTGVPGEYQLRCITGENSTTSEILKPDSIAGIKATIESDTCRIEYMDLALDAMMLPIRGMTPADCFDQTVFSLRYEVPLRYNYEKRNGKECLCLSFSEEISGYQVTKSFWLAENTLELLEGEYYLDDTLVMRMTVETFVFTENNKKE